MVTNLYQLNCMSYINNILEISNKSHKAIENNILMNEIFRSIPDNMIQVTLCQTQKIEYVSRG